jgi:secreted PhoX family phosphatase
MTSPALALPHSASWPSRGRPAADLLGPRFWPIGPYLQLFAGRSSVPTGAIAGLPESAVRAGPPSNHSPWASNGDVKSGKAEYFDAGQSFVLRVGDGNTFGATGAFTWVPFTDATGAALPGAITITDPNGITSVDARNTTNKAAFKGTDYNRPEDMQIQSVRDADYLYMTPTDTHEVFRIDLKHNTISLFVNRNTIDLATGRPVGTAFANPDNLAIDHDGNIYIVEDRNGGSDDDIWFAKDLNGDGDLNDPGEGIGRWASNGTVGSEFTGLYFDPTDKRRAWVNIQHPASGNDRTIEITIPNHDE